MFPARLSDEMVEVLTQYLARSEHAAHSDAPLFCSFDRRTRTLHAPLTPKSVLKIVKSYGAQIGRENLTARDLRLTAIHGALDVEAQNGLRAGEQFAHLRSETWESYRRQCDGSTA
jgi:hypothetical protein